MKTKLLLFTLLFVGLTATAQDRKGSFEVSGGYGYNFATFSKNELPHNPAFINEVTSIVNTNPISFDNLSAGLLQGSMFNGDLAYYFSNKTAITAGFNYLCTRNYTRVERDSIGQQAQYKYRTKGYYFTLGLKHYYTNPEKKLKAFVGGGANLGLFTHNGDAVNISSNSSALNFIIIPTPTFFILSADRYIHTGGLYWGFNLYTGVEYQLNKRFSIYADIYGAGFWGKPEELEISLSFDDTMQPIDNVLVNTDNTAIKRPQINMNFISARAGLRVHFYKKGS